MADDILTIGITEERSCIASILILQQLTEELVKILLKSCNFLIQVGLLPLEINFNNKKNKAFGRVLEELKSTINFPEKEKLISIANKIYK